MHQRRVLLIAVISMVAAASSFAAPKAPATDAMDRDLFEVTVPQLERFYAEHKYTVTRVLQWHLARIHRYNGIYRAVEQVLEKQALETAAREDAEAAHGAT